MDFETWLSGVVGQESGGNYEARNQRTGAYGKFQIMPGNWKNWSEEVLGHEADPTDPQAQEAVSRGKLQQYFNDYGPEGALVAWYAGETNGARWRDGAPDAIGEGGHYSWDAKQGAGDEPSVREYVQQALGKAGGDLLTANFQSDKNPFGLTKATPQETTQSPEISTWQEAKDKFLNNFYDTTIGGALRLAYMNLNRSNDPTKIEPQHTISQQDVDYVTKMFPGDYETQKFLLLNAKDPQHLAELAMMKKEDEERMQRVSSYGWGWVSSPASFLGMALGDPLTYVPVLGIEGAAAKGLMRLGSAAKYVKATTLGKYAAIAADAVKTNKLLRYADVGTTVGALETADRYGAKQFGGFNDQDYGQAFLMGSLLGGGMSALGDLWRFSRNAAKAKVAATLDSIEEHAAAEATGSPLAPNRLPETRSQAEALHDPLYNLNLRNQTLKELQDNGKIFTMDNANFRSFAQKLGIELPEDTRAFYNPGEKYAVINKDALKPGDNLDGLLAHEIGVHDNLKDFVGEKQFNSILKYVEDQRKNPQGIWKQAFQRAPGGGAEEVLGHYIELSTGKKNAFMDRLGSAINGKLRNMGMDKDLSSAEVRDFIRRSLQNALDREGYKLFPDGTAVVNGIRYSANSLTNPEVIKGVVSSEAQVLADRQGKLGRIGRSLEAGKLFGTIGGILGNSRIDIMRKIAATLFHDARMKEYKGLMVMPAEQMKQYVLEQLGGHYGAFLDIRDKFIHKNAVGLPFELNIRKAQMDFNKEVLEFYNHQYAVHNVSDPSKVYPPEVQQAAAALKKYRDDMIEIGKKSAEMFGVDGKQNIIDASWIPKDHEFFRVTNDDRWLSELMTQFDGDDEKFYKFLAEYGERAAKRPIVEKRLLEQKGKEWDEAKVDWETKHLTYQKELEQWEEEVAKIEARDEERYAKMIDSWGEKVETWKVTVANLPKGAKRPPYPKKPARPIDSLKPRKPQEPSPLPGRPTTLQEAFRQQLIDNKTSEWWNKVYELKEKGVNKFPPKPKPEDITPEELNEFAEAQFNDYIRREAADWAYGMVDKDTSNFNNRGEGSSGSLTFMRERFPMDTSVTVKTPKGFDFSFDDNLRDYDLDRTLSRISERFSGEVAFRNAFGSEKAYNELRQEIEQKHYGQAGNRQMIDAAQRKRELDALDRGIALLRGKRIDHDVTDALDAFAAMARGLSYSQNGGNMGWNQIGELGGAIGTLGFKAILHAVPIVDRWITSAIHGEDYVRALDDVRRHLFGDNIQHRIWSTSWESRLWHDATAMDSKLRKLDSANTAINIFGKVVSTVNLLPKLTEWMVNGARAESIADSVEWAFGKEFSSWRNPFSEGKLKAAGVDQEMAQRIREDIQRYTTRDANGNMQHMDVERWQHENQTTFWKWKFLLDNQSMRSIQQATIGNKAYLTDSSSFMKMLFQFKDFSMKAVNGQTLRALTSMEKDAGVAALGSMATNLMVYAGLTTAKSYAYFPDDKQKRQDYLKEQLSPGRLVAAAVLRGVITGSILGFGNDAYEILTGNQSMRTTVDRTLQWQKQQPTSSNWFVNEYDKIHNRVANSPGQVAGDFITQAPAIRAVTSLGGATIGLAGTAVDPRHDITQQQLRNAFKVMPLQNLAPMVYLSGQLASHSGLPEKDQKQQRIKEKPSLF